VFANVGQENPAKWIFVQRRRTDDLISFRTILFQKHDVPPCRCPEVAGIIIGISRPRESVVRHLIPFFARDLASFAADANSRIREEANLNVIVHVGMFPLIRAPDSFADHKVVQASRLRVPLAASGTHVLLLADLMILPSFTSPHGNFTPVGGCSGCKFAGLSVGAYFLIQSSNAGITGKPIAPLAHRQSARASRAFCSTSLPARSRLSVCEFAAPAAISRATQQAMSFCLVLASGAIFVAIFLFGFVKRNQRTLASLFLSS
jgi:hypothetical protein